MSALAAVSFDVKKGNKTTTESTIDKRDGKMKQNMPCPESKDEW